MKGQDLILKSWKYIAYWLDNETQYINSKSLARGTREEILQQFQEELTIKLPADFCYSYLIHNGFRKKTGLVHGGDLLSLHEIKKTYYSLIRKSHSVKWDSDMLPVVEFNDTEFLCLNVRDNQVYCTEFNPAEQRIESYVTNHSFTDFLSELATDLEEGNGCMGELLGK